MQETESWTGLGDSWRLGQEAMEAQLASIKPTQRRMDIAAEAVRELNSARQKHAGMRGPHEGYAILLEEVDELWDEVKGYPKRSDLHRMRAEAIQIAAMAIAFVDEVCS